MYKLVHRQGTFNSFIFNVNLCSTLDIVSSIIDLQLCVSDCFLNFNFRARRLRPVERHVNLIVNPWIVSDACSLSSHVLLTRCIYVCLFYGEITTYYRRQDPCFDIIYTRCSVTSEKYFEKLKIMKSSRRGIFYFIYEFFII